jgi:cytochrome o ubiquinol oxidase subunit II
VLFPVLVLAGCTSESFRLFHPDGPVASAEWRFTLIDVGVMMLIILPVTVMIGVFVWRYRKSRNAAYDPAWSHSLPLELAMWGIPLLIVALLTYYSYQSVFMVNPYRPTVLNDNAQAAMAEAPLKIDVVTTDWQWFFIYPDQHIATIDDLVVPQGRDVELRMTSATVVNDFYIPQIVAMIDVMPGMQTRDAFRANDVGDFSGFSADYSGVGFSWMNFMTHVVTPANFDSWVTKVQAAPVQLSYAQFQKLAQPTINLRGKTAYFSAVDPDLFDKVYAAVRQGEVFPVSADLTKHMAHYVAAGASAAGGGS